MYISVKVFHVLNLLSEVQKQYVFRMLHSIITMVSGFSMETTVVPHRKSYKIFFLSKVTVAYSLR